MTWIWFALAGALLAAELVTLTIVLSAIAVAAVVAGIVAALDGPLLVQALAFAVSGTGLTLAALPYARKVRALPGTATGIQAMRGKQAVVIAEVRLGQGRAKIGGETWSARPLDPTREFPEGRTVVVAEVEGATLVVYDPEDL